MLYDTNETKDLIVVKKDRINIKKVIIFITVVLMCFLTIFLSFLISYKSMNKNNNIEIATVEKETKTEKNSKNSNIYLGEHSEISTHNIEEIKAKFVPVYNENAKQEIKEIYNSDEKQVYLTFDDGPSRDVTPEILDILKEENILATFFVLGSRVELYPDTIKRIYDEGHYIANHGYSHKYSLIYQNTETVLQEYNQCEQIIKNALNNQEYNSYLFRFPGGSSAGVYADIKSQTKDLFDQNNIAYTNWNCLTGDAEGVATKEEQIQKFYETKGDNASLVILMHDSNDKEQTPDTLRELIQILKSEGYTFKNFYEIF